MSSLFDFISSSIVFGVLVLTVARVQLNINSTMYQNQYNVITQTNAVELARKIESDFSKIGYHVNGQHILFADSSSIRFCADLENNSTVTEVRYIAGDTREAQVTVNPRDFPLYRGVGETSVKQNFGLTSFSLSYFDSSYCSIPTPVISAAALARIRSIRIAFMVESSEPVYTKYDTTWASVSWEKMILPRNLKNLR